ncbi:unnamed protein product [Periconia digitata]|uniref:Zn(2)-C6 fungal-type domain-containing protein n=1 Tax=Periconia digitata TaxID=1303443 RepID=A0A9W4XM61_9PLEO|nr:unnamed protein product [Periconia digitata]
MEKPRKRAKHTRSKLGCRVCRIRRVRCDSTRPSCVKCTSTGRTCEWYPTPDRTDSSVIRIARPNFSSFAPFNSMEDRFLKFYRNNTVFHMTGQCRVDFWATTLLQISEYEPCIRYGLVALGALHESFDDEQFSNSRLFPHDTEIGHYAWIYYIKAIESLKMYIDLENWKGVDVALCCCVLCAVFEWLRGCYTTAETHLRSGLSILNRWAADDIQNGGTDEPKSSTRANLVRHHLTPVLHRLVTQTRTFIATPLPCTALLVSEQDYIPSPHLKAARNELYGILGQLNTDSHSSKSTEKHFKNTNDQKHLQILSRLSEWYGCYHLLLSDKNPHSMSLVISHTLITIMVRTSLSTDQMQFDEFNDDFRLIVDLASARSSSSASDGEMPVSIEVVPVLYYVALKCRDPCIRRRAVTLIQGCNKRALPWDSDAFARIAGEVVSVEEEGIDHVESSSCVPAAARVDRLYYWTDVYRRDSSIRFRRQGNREWSGMRFVTW